MYCSREYFKTSGLIQQYEKSTLNKFLVSLANSPNTFSSIINSVISLLPRFGSKQTNPNKTIKNKKQTITETDNTNNCNIDLNVSTDTIADVDMSDLEHLSANAVHYELHHNPSPHKNLFPDSVRNEMLTLYNCIVIGSCKNFFQFIDMNNLAEVLKALRELNFILANRVPELAPITICNCNQDRLQQKEFPTLSGLTLVATQLIIWSTVPEEDPTLEVTNTTGTANSHC